jgi:uncharacterized protein YhaN
MRIDTIHIDHYGGLNDLNLSLDGGFQVIQGLNEEGKTTLLAFVRGVFFGFKQALPHIGVRSAPFYTEGERMGGRIKVMVELDGKERRYEVIRHTPTQDGTLSIRDIDSNRLFEDGEAGMLRDRILGGVDKTLFNNVFVLTVDDLHNLKALTQDEVAYALFSADSGLGLELPRELSAMLKEMDRLYNPEHGRGKQPHRVLTADLNRLSKEITKLNTKMKELSGQRGARERMSGRLEELRKTRSGLALEVKRASDRITARGHKARVEELMGVIAELSEGPFPVDSDRARLASLRGEISSLENELDGLNEEIESLETKQSNLTLDTAAEGNNNLLQAVHVADMVERVAEVETANELRDEMADLPDIDLEEGFETRMTKAFSRLRAVEVEFNGLAEGESIAEVSLGKYEPKVLNAGLASETDEALTRRISQLSDPLDDAEGQVKRIEDDLKVALNSAGGMDAEELDDLPLDPASISRLRASLFESGYAPHSRFARMQTLIALSALALGLGIILVLDEMLGGGGLVLIGLLLLILDRLETQGVEGGVELSGSVIKQLKRLGLSSHASATDLDRLVNRLAAATKLAEELSKAKSSRDEMKTRYTIGLELLHRLAEDCGLEAVDAGASAAHLEGVLNELMEKHRYAVAQVQVLKGELQTNHASQAILTKQREENTRDCDSIFAELSVDDQEAATAILADIIRRIEIKTELGRLASAERVIEQVQKAVEAACNSVKEKIPSLDDLATVYTAQYERAKKAVSVRVEHDELERQLVDQRPRAERRIVKKAELDAEASELLTSFGLGSDDEMEPAVEAGENRLEQEDEMMDEERQFTTLANHWEGFEAELEEADPIEDEAICTEQELRDGGLGVEINTLQGQLNDLNAELLNLDQSDELTRVQAEKTATQAELGEVNLRWAHLFLVRSIIERAREQYEGTHGSEVLRRASEHLERVTGGRYTQILRTDEDPGYQLVEASGSYRSPIPPDVSRAFYAQIYLSIRLAYAEMGTHSNLPIILDDAFEGYDDERVLPALDILCELGEMRQVMLFSHHGHICKAAEAREVPVIQL